jgi:GNAT superfamily N-acetyltransferase
MWESFREMGEQWVVIKQDKPIGYAVIGENNTLIQFFVSGIFHNDGELLLGSFMGEHGIKEALVGTNNPSFLSLAMPMANKVSVHSLFFRDFFEVEIDNKQGELRSVQQGDIESVIQFYMAGMGAPEEWLTGYLTALVERQEVYILELEGKIIGACEVRKSESDAKYADIGMVVAPEMRRQGYGAFLLYKARAIAEEWNCIPICSCERENKGSLKAIQNAGFICRFQLLHLVFD